MQRQILTFRDFKTGDYVVMVCWTAGPEVGDIKTYEKIDRYETLDDVRKMAETLNGILERWGKDESVRAD